jgi:hypothetical protein
METTSTPGQHPPGPCPPAEEDAGRKQSMEHLSTAGIGDFLACLLPREQNRLVVRHLLARCPTCLSEVQFVLHPATAFFTAVRRESGRLFFSDREILSEPGSRVGEARCLEAA